MHHLTEEVGSNPANQPVTIPYFLYEAMARAYYSHPRNTDIPVETPPVSGGNMNFKDVMFDPLDVPSHWKPGGVAAKERPNVTPEVQTPEE
tara:strand:- start:7034 stop:7306 length:273 start_codon:yes stop_codon:yes gene_type:complete